MRCGCPGECIWTKCKCSGVEFQSVIHLIRSGFLLKDIQDGRGPGRIGRGIGKNCGECLRHLASALETSNGPTAEFGGQNLASARIVSKKQIARQTLGLKLVTKDLVANAAQTVFLGSESCRKPFTIVGFDSSSGVLELAVKLNPTGDCTPWLFAKSEGDLVWMEPPCESAVSELKANKVICFAAGIGITPAIGLARRERPSGVQVCIHATFRSREESPFREHVEKLVAEGVGQIHYTCSKGRPTQLDFLEAIARWDCGSDAVVVSGPPAYVSHVAVALSASGVPPNRIVTERVI